MTEFVSPYAEFLELVSRDYEKRRENGEFEQDRQTAVIKEPDDAELLFDPITGQYTGGGIA